MVAVKPSHEARCGTTGSSGVASTTAASGAVGSLLAKMRWLDGLRYCGEYSIVIYLAFFLPMAAMRILLLAGIWIPALCLLTAWIEPSG